jgi:hypothetical protein
MARVFSILIFGVVTGTTRIYRNALEVKVGTSFEFLD